MGRIKERTYLLFIYGVFKDNERVKGTVSALIPVLSTKTMKYIWGDYGIVCMFSSNVRFAELSDFVFAHISGESNQYFLTEKTDKLSVYGPDKVMEHLLSSDDFIPSLDEDSTDEFIYDFLKKQDFNFKEIDLNRIINDFKLIEDNQDEEDEDIEKIKTQSKKKVQEPSLDDILEKIQIDGINALTSQEKKLLDDYSHGK
jgi:hypothetical protein